jgi:L-alanine-DL-glutamate epimerase-like enolase superfamily enzyme
MSTYATIADLPLRVDGYGLERRSRSAGEWERITTTIHLHGAGDTGLGEDVTYDEGDQKVQLAHGPVLELDGDWTFDGFSQHLDGLDLFHGQEPSSPAYPYYRRWAFESAALDLALRQAGIPLHEALGREPRPLTFVTSLRLGSPPSFEPLERRPGMHFKLDYDTTWTQEFLDRLAATGRCEVVDLKGAYKGTPVDVDTDAELYRAIAETLPDVWLEDPDVTDPEAVAVLEPHADRVTWDAPFHHVDDIAGFRWAPKCLNVKPSRFGAIRNLFEVYDHCEAHGITMYSGGQSELGVGRHQIQLLASIFHPDTPNDVAPSGWDWADPPPGLPPSPLDPAPAAKGFQRRQ